METATEAEGAETPMAETSLSITAAVMMGETVAAAAAAVVFAAVQVGRSFFHQTRWRFHRARRTSPLKCPPLWNVAALPKATVQALLSVSDISPKFFESLILLVKTAFHFFESLCRDSLSLAFCKISARRSAEPESSDTALLLVLL